MKAKFNKNHLIIMSLGNIIGSGIFLGSSTIILNAGPAAVFAYLLGGILMAVEIMFVTEMSILNPAPGAFRVHATEIFGPWIGFVNGWMFWLSGVLGMASEVAAAAIFTRYWFTGIPLWVFCVIYTVVMTFINFNDLHNLSKIESILASVKVIALFLFVILGILILFKIVPIEHHANPFSSMEGLFPKGFKGIFSSMILVMFSYTGTGIIGLAITDMDQPEKDAPSAINMIIFSVVSLFVLSIFLITWLIPWNSLSPMESPFVSILNRLHIPYSDNVLNFIVLTAALSGLNSSMYSSSRMINSLSRDKQAPKLFANTNKNGVPVFALVLSSLALLLTAVLSYVLPDQVFVILATSSGFLALFNWLTITVTHYFYRKKTLAESPQKLKYKAYGYPFTNAFEIVLILAITGIAFFTGERISIIVGIAILIILFFMYLTLKKLHLLK